jgi:hypothetical protein
MMNVGERVRALLGIDLPELGGASLGGEIPLSNALVNRLVERQLAGRQLPVTGVRVEAHDGQQLTIALTPRARFVPSITIAARIDQQPEFPHEPVLGLRWSIPGTGPLAAIAGPIIASFRLPPGIRIVGDRVLVDVRELLQARGLGELLQYVAGLRVGTREGAVLVRFELRV